jgi:hypothetical protein
MREMLGRIFISAFLLALALPGQVLGDDFRILPSLSVREEYNSNLYFSASDIKRDFITTLSPGVKLIEKTERLNSELLAQIDRREYIDNRELNATDQTYKGKARYSLTELLGLSADAGYVINSRPDRDITETGLVLTTSRRNHFNASMSADQRVTEKTIALLSYTYTKNSYEEIDADDASHNVTGGMEHDFGRYASGTKGRVNVAYDHDEFTDSKLDSVAGTMGISRNFNETWSVSIDGGARHTWSRFSTSEQTMERSGWTGKISLSYKGKSVSGALGYYRDLMPASGYGGATERNAVSLSASYRTTRGWDARLSAGYYTNKSDSVQYSVQKIDTQSFSINPSIRYEFSKDIAIDASYNYTLYEDRQLDTTRVDRHLFLLQFYIQHAFFE